MTAAANILELPLYLVGVPDQVADWLRQAGFPVQPLGQDSLMKSAFRTHFGSAMSEASPARCLLFDSRDVWSRSVVKTYQKYSCHKLDIAGLLAPLHRGQVKTRANGDVLNPMRFLFLEQLKKSIESLGGLWARLADFPFPYQGVGCLNGELPGGTLPMASRANQPSRLDQIQQRYHAGLPTSITERDLSSLADLPPVTGLQSRGLPLLWRARPSDFSQWWQHRNHLEVRLWQTPTHYRVDCPKLHPSFCPVLEIWRGNHLASVPLRSESIVVRKDGLVFQHQPTRHPAGFTAGWSDATSDGSSPCLSA
jgi:hypothetical protein